jgi:hypothetical protein
MILFGDIGSIQLGGLECKYGKGDIDSLLVWETEVHPNDGGLDTSLTKREC